MRSAVVSSSRNRKARGGIDPAAAAPSLDRNFGGRSTRARGAYARARPSLLRCGAITLGETVEEEGLWA